MKPRLPCCVPGKVREDVGVWLVLVLVLVPGWAPRDGPELGAAVYLHLRPFLAPDGKHTLLNEVLELLRHNDVVWPKVVAPKQHGHDRVPLTGIHKDLRIGDREDT